MGVVVGGFRMAPNVRTLRGRGLGRDGRPGGTALATAAVLGLALVALVALATFPAPSALAAAPAKGGHMRGALDRIRKRLEAPPYREHTLATYLASSTDIIDRLVRAIDEDSRAPGGGLEFEVMCQTAECEMLLSSLQKELDLIDRNLRFAKGVARKTIDVRRMGARGDGKRDDGPAIRAALERAKAAGPGARVFIPAGRYLLASTGAGAHLTLDGMRDLTIEGDPSAEGEPGTTLVMRKVAGAILVKGCRNVRLRGIAVDYDPLPFAQGKIVAVDRESNAFEMKLDEGYPDPAGDVFTKARYLRGTVRDPKTGLIDLKTGDPRVRKVERVGDGRYRLHVMDNRTESPKGLVDAFRTGMAFVLNARATPGGGPAVVVRSSEYVTLEDVKVYASYSHTFLALGCKGLKLLRCVAEPLPGSERLACNNADGIHLASQVKGPYMDGCRFHFVNDDCYNSYARWHCLVREDSPRVFTISRAGPEDYRKGDSIAVMNPMSGRLEGFARLVDVKTVPWRNTGRPQLHLDRALEGVVTRDDLGLGPVAEREHLRRKGNVEHFVCNLGRKGDGFVIVNCDFGFNRAGGMKVKAPNGIVRNVTFRRHQGAAVLLKVALDWREGYYPHNVVVRGNTILSRVGIARVITLPGGRRAPHRDMFRRLVVEGNVTRPR